MKQELEGLDEEINKVYTEMFKNISMEQEILVKKGYR